jgi:transcriptional activator SPT8
MCALSASVDCVRLWNTADLWNPESNMKKSKSGVPFRIVAGHHGGTVSKIREYFFWKIGEHLLG